MRAAIQGLFPQPVKIIAAFVRNRAVATVASVFLMIGTLMMIATPLCIALGMFGDVNTGGARGNSIVMRLALWQLGWSNFIDHPLTGMGLGELISVRATTTLFENDLPYYHSVLVNYLAKTGIIGTIGLLTLIFTTQYRVFMAMIDLALSKWDSGNIKVTNFAAIVTLVTLVTACVEGELQGNFISFELFFLAAALLPLPQSLLAREQLEERNRT